MCAAIMEVEYKLNRVHGIFTSTGHSRRSIRRHREQAFKMQNSLFLYSVVASEFSPKKSKGMARVQYCSFTQTQRQCVDEPCSFLSKNSRQTFFMKIRRDQTLRVNYSRTYQVSPTHDDAVYFQEEKLRLNFCTLQFPMETRNQNNVHRTYFKITFFLLFRMAKAVKLLCDVSTSTKRVLSLLKLYIIVF